MKVKELIKIVPVAFLLFSCGGEATDELDATESENSEETSKGESGEKFGSTFGDCAGANSVSIEKEQIESGIKDYFANDDFSKFTHRGGELSKSMEYINVVISNNAANTTPSYSSLGAGDVIMLMKLKMTNGKLKAGQYSDDNAEIELRRGEKLDGVMRTSPFGSSSYTEKVVLNDISRGHACGTYMLMGENGEELVKIEFDTDISMSAW